MDARSHYYALTGAGWTLRSVAAHAGVCASDLSRWTRGANLPHVEAGVVRVPLGTLAERTTPKSGRPESVPFVPRVGTVRRVQALLYMGWRHEDITAAAQQYGQANSRLTANLLAQQGRWVTRTTHDMIAAVYRDLSHLQGPSERTRLRARNRGFVGPLDWDDIDHDEAPADSSDEVDDDVTYLDEAAILRRMNGDRDVRLTPAEAAELVARWQRSGRPLRDCERITGLNAARYLGGAA